MKTRGEQDLPKERPSLVLTMGDPCGVGPEVVLKGLADERLAAAARLVVVGEEGILRRTAREQKLRWPFAGVVRELPAERWEKPLLLAVREPSEELLPGRICAAGGRVAVEAIERGVEICRAGRAAGIVTAPIHKEAISLAGIPEPGHTEMLARLTGAPRVAMMFWTPDFSVALLSTHLALAEAIRKVRCKRILEQLVFIEREWRRLFGRAPRVAVAGLNPHSGEGGRFGVEESLYIRPAVEKAREDGLIVNGPVPPDSVFAQAKEGRYDLVLALYHDQATIPVKTCYGRRAVNVTLGLPFVRTSVDHGTAMDIAGKGIASEESVVAATLLGARLAAVASAPAAD